MTFTEIAKDKSPVAAMEWVAEYSGEYVSNGIENGSPWPTGSCQYRGYITLQVTCVYKILRKNASYDRILYHCSNFQTNLGWNSTCTCIWDTSLTLYF